MNLAPGKGGPFGDGEDKCVLDGQIYDEPGERRWDGIGSIGGLAGGSADTSPTSLLCVHLSLCTLSVYISHCAQLCADNCKQL